MDLTGGLVLGLLVAFFGWGPLADSIRQSRRRRRACLFQPGDRVNTSRGHHPGVFLEQLDDEWARVMFDHWPRWLDRSRFVQHDGTREGCVRDVPIEDIYFDDDAARSSSLVVCYRELQ